MHARVRRDELRDTSCADQRRGAVVALAQVGNHVASHVARARIVDHRLQSVANFDLVLPLFGSDQDQYAAIVLLRPDAEMLVEIGGVVFARFAFERVDGDDGNLRAGLLLQLGGEQFDLLAGRRIDDLRQVGDIALRLDVGDLLRPSRLHQRDKQQH